MPWKPTVHRPAGAKSSAEVKRELDRQRPSAARRGYDSRWRRARSLYLAEHPWCARCLDEGRLTPATVVDHVEPHRGDERLFWDQDQWQALCKQHHDAKTVRDGRWGRRHLSDGAARSIYGCDVPWHAARPRPPLEPPLRGGARGMWPR
jgi:5-methylcytosine-specific restriction enzyme A